MDHIELLKLAQNGDEKSKEQLILENTGLVWSIVKRFLNRGYEREDLFQIGCLGMIKAINQFDFRFHVAFSTYAVPMIMGEIKRFLRDDGIVKVSRQIKENRTKIAIYRQKYIAEYGKEPTIDEIKNECFLKEEDVVCALEVSNSVMSIDSEKNEYSLSLERFPVENDFEGKIINKISVAQAIKYLEKLEQDIVTLRYYNNKTQKETGKILGLTQVQVSRMETKIIAKLRMNLLQ